MTVPAQAPCAAAAGSALPAPDSAPDTARITALVHGFYADVRADPLLGPVFEQALGAGDWAAHLARMVDFWSTVVLGSKRYRGNVFSKHMQLQGVEPAHFAAWVRLWALQTERLFAPEVALELQSVAHGMGRNLFKGLFGQVPSFDEARVQAHRQAHAEHAAHAQQAPGHS